MTFQLSSTSSERCVLRPRAHRFDLRAQEIPLILSDFLWPLMVTCGSEHRSLPVAMQQFFSQDPKVWGDITFASMITITVLVVFLLFQKWFVQSVATSGIKGGA